MKSDKKQDRRGLLQRWKVLDSWHASRAGMAASLAAIRCQKDLPQNSVQQQHQLTRVPGRTPCLRQLLDMVRETRKSCSIHLPQRLCYCKAWQACMLL